MFLWFLSVIFLVGGIIRVLTDFPLGSVVGNIGAIGRERNVLVRTISIFQEFEETLSAGLLPNPERWRVLEKLPFPWGTLASESIQELRSQGGALLPTLRRLRVFAEQHLAALGEARARSAQSLAQALMCAALVPLFGLVLYVLLPGVGDQPRKWVLVCCLGLLFSGAGALWMLEMAEVARWGGLSAARRPWLLAAQCGAERFLAMIRAGTPADLAWLKSCELLSKSAPELAADWGFSVWSQGKPEPGPSARAGVLQIFTDLGVSLRKSVQVSLMEGRPCTERAEAALEAFRRALNAQIERELTLLGTRTLKPLFFCVAPSLLGLLAFGFWMAWNSGFSGG